MSDMIQRPKAKTGDVLAMPKHETCGTCKHAEIVPQDVTQIICYGAPPTPVMMGMQQTVAGQQPMIVAVHPVLTRGEHACSLWARKNAVLM